ncbi:MAG TPA: Gfo/Idh/MocA family oxidoreductase [bacterium]|nr:Gfo/Idh/MocA family oxidoreductase [bacterium]HQO33035.1 Gfo/Idh/MocA family oxidoreductase [bacterium]HQP98082.1 Gfo/Idh/MocA family oxidoreductase [bacterium]
MKKHRAVMAGCGAMAAEWLHLLADMEDIEIVGLVDINPESARKRAEEYRLDQTVLGTELKPVLQKTSPDIVFDITVPEAHLGITLTALEHGCHVLGEKPLADSMENARTMVAAAQKAGKIYAVIQNRRYDPNIRRLKAFLNSGAIGPITTVNCDFYIGAHFGGFRDRMRHVLLLDMAIHTFDAARLIMGADPVAVYCKEWNPAGSWYDHDASAVAIFEMSNGIVYTYRGSWCAEGLNTTWECDWRILGERGSVTWDGAQGFRAQAVEATGGFQSKWKDLEIPSLDPADRVGGHVGVIREFIECVESGAVPETLCTENIKSLSMVFGAVKSATTGRQVDIRLI